MTIEAKKINPRLKQAVEQYYCSNSPVYWARLRRSLRGNVYKFWGDHPTEQRRFLEEPLNDTNPKMCGKKARQVGWSENSVTFALWFADTHPHSAVIYTLPTIDFVSDFSNTRVQPVIDESTYLSKVCGGYRSGGKKKIENVTLKRINQSYMFIRSMGSERAGMGFPIDLAIWDEVDASNERNKEVFRAMLDASKYKWERELSTPTIPGRGISRTYNLSNKKRWEVKCKHCGHWQFMEFPDCIGEFGGKHVFLCRYCHSMDSLDRANGRWVITGDKDAPYSGYHISQLEAPWITAEDVIFKQKTSRYPQLFHNLVLGKEYVGDNVLLTEQDIEQCMDYSLTPEIVTRLKATGKVMHGIDWGDVSWGLTGIPVLYQGRERLLITDIHKWTHPDINFHTRFIGMMIRTNNSFTTVLDAGYGKAQNQSLIKEFPGAKIFVCQYINTKKGATTRVIPVWNDKQSRVVVQRDAQLKYYFFNFKERMIVIPAYLKNDPNWREFISHSTSLVISRKEENIEIEEDIEATGDDHLAHCGVYLMTAFERLVKRSVRAAMI